MTYNPNTLAAIPPHHPLDWDKIRSISIDPVDDPLIQITDLNRQNLILQPYYYQQQILGATPEFHIRKSVLNKLHYASTLLPSGLRLKLLDAWRPRTLQAALVDSFNADIELRYPAHTPEEKQKILALFVSPPSANPYQPSPHMTGGSVDVTLCDEHGQSLDLGTDFDAPVDESWTTAFEPYPEHPAHRHRRILYWAMINAGFTNLPSEWWHFDYGNQLWAYFKQQPKAYYLGIAE